jgi:ketosteroid isomerase-like protein
MRGSVVAVLTAFCIFTTSLAQGSPAEVMDAYTAAINAGNVDAALELVADDAHYERPVGAFVGNEEVRTFVAGLVAQQAHIELIGKRATDGDRVRWYSRVNLTTPSGPSTVVNMSESIVMDGRIVHHQAQRLPTDPAAVMDAYTAAINAHDAEAAMLFVSDEATYNRPLGIFGGHPEIRGFIQDLIDHGVSIELIGERSVEGERVRWSSVVRFSDPAPGAPAEVRNASESLVRDGKILEHRATRQP